MNGCEQICYQQWVDMYNKKDKECFDLQLKLSRVEEICKKWLNDSWSCFNCRNNMDEKLEDILQIIRGEE